MTLSRIVYYSQIFFIFGIFLISYFNKTWILIPGFLILGISFLIVFNKLKTIRIISFFILFLSFGIFWGYLSFLPRDKTADTSGLVVEEPDKRERSTHLVIENELGIKTLVVTDRYSKVSFYDKILINGKIEKPKPFEGFDYPGYLAAQGISFVSFYPEIEIKERKDIFWGRALILNIRNKSREFIHYKFGEPHGAILSALILGYQRQITSTWQEKLNASGISHVVAVSGQHITVLTFLVISFFGYFFEKRISLIFSIIFIFLFLVLIGFPSSAVRAGIMGFVAILGKLFGRMSDSNRLILLAGFSMLFINPLLLKHDIGFQLSFLAAIGIVNFSNFFNNRVFKSFPKIIKETLSSSFSAQVFTLPLMVYYFKEISIIFPITNALILPFVYSIMVLGIFFLIFSFFSYFLANIFFFPLYLLTIYLVNVVYYFSAIPWASISVGPLFLIIYLIFFLSVWRLEKRLNLG